METKQLGSMPNKTTLSEFAEDILIKVKEMSGKDKEQQTYSAATRGDIFVPISKLYSKDMGWIQATYAYEAPTGCLIKTTTKQKNLDGSYSISEALAFVPGVKIKDL